MMTSQAGGNLCGTGCAAGPTIRRRSTDPRMARRPAGRGTPLDQAARRANRAATAARAGDTSQRATTSPAATSHRRAATVSVPPAAATSSAPSASPPPAASGRYQDAPEPASPVGARAARAATAPRRSAREHGHRPRVRALRHRPLRLGFHGHPHRTPTRTWRILHRLPRVLRGRPRDRGQGPAGRQAPEPVQGRGRSSRGRHDDDDDDWPSTEWDKLSDEQYWAELSADKPLATTARSAQPSSAPPYRRPARQAAPGPVPAASLRSPGRAASRPQRSPGRPSLDDPAARPPSPPHGPRPALLQPPGHAAAAGWRGHAPGRRGGPADRPASPCGPGHRAVAGQAPPAGRGSRPRPAPHRSGPPGAARDPEPAGPGRGRPADQPAFRRRSAAADDSRSFRTSRRNPDAAGRTSGGQLTRARRTRTPASRADAGYPASSAAHPAPRDGYRPPPARRASPQHPGPVPRAEQLRWPGPRQLCRPVGRPRLLSAGACAAAAIRRQAGRHGYPARASPTATDPGASRTDPGGSRTSPGRRRSTAAPQAPVTPARPSSRQHRPSGPARPPAAARAGAATAAPPPRLPRRRRA